MTQFKNLSKLANSTKMFRVERPAYPLQLSEFADFIQQKIIESMKLPENKRIIWLASYPKSGNTWFRVFLMNLLSDSVFSG